MADFVASLFESRADVLDTLLSATTALIAIAVYMEARRIRRVEWFSKTSKNWQDFNRLILDTDMSDRWRDIIIGKAPWDALSQKDMMIIYSFLNVLVFEFNAKSKGLLASRYAEKSIGDNIKYLKAVWPDLYPHLKSDGWPSDFLHFANRKIR
ncbi:MAG: hypothetical protein AAGA09_06825 [Pseudomonadota bacterium]